jgi:hypothetical protein
MGRGGSQSLTGGDLLQFQVAVSIDLELRAISQLNGDAAIFAGPDDFAHLQGFADPERLPAPFPHDLDSSQGAHELTCFLRQSGADWNEKEEQQQKRPNQPGQIRLPDWPVPPHSLFRGGNHSRVLPHPSCPHLAFINRHLLLAYRQAHDIKEDSCCWLSGDAPTTLPGKPILVVFELSLGVFGQKSSEIKDNLSSQLT